MAASRDTDPDVASTSHPLLWLVPCSHMHLAPCFQRNFSSSLTTRVYDTCVCACACVPNLNFIYKLLVINFIYSVTFYVKSKDET